MRIEPDWYLAEWIGRERGAQSKLAALAGWDKRKASQLLSGKQSYNRQSLNEAAQALHIAPFELLLHPDDAMALRRLRNTALQIAADSTLAFEPAAPNLDELVKTVKARRR